MKILFVASEAFPLIKTGGLGDVCGGLPPALPARECDVRLLLPAYRDALAAHVGTLTPIARLKLPPLATPVTLLEGRLPGTRIAVWFVDFPPAYDRRGDPYHDAYGNSWPDNAARFALLARAAVAVALGQADIRWQPDVVHCHDWQTGLVPALLAQHPQRPASVFTLHNLAYQGQFPSDTLTALALPQSLWSPQALEFHGQLSFIKGGLVFADRLTTVSPTYAREIQTPEHGQGLDGVLRHRRRELVGILNGIDEKTWNPARDRSLIATYSSTRLAGKRKNKAALQRELGLAPDANTLLVGMIGRLAYQKGVDLALAALPQLLQPGSQLAILGAGEPALERSVRAAAIQYPGRCAAIVDYDETLAHRIVAGADALLMPSRFEPCGLTQLYALRYGTVPIVRRVGGLADTVADGISGIVFDSADPQALADAHARALALFGNRPAWRKLMAVGMRQNFSWRNSAHAYARLYREAVRDR